MYIRSNFVSLHYKNKDSTRLCALLTEPWKSIVIPWLKKCRYGLKILFSKRQLSYKHFDFLVILLSIILQSFAIKPIAISTTVARDISDRTVLFNSSHWCSIGFISRLGEGQSRTILKNWYYCSCMKSYILPILLHTYFLPPIYHI